MGVYVYAPAGAERLQNNILEKCIKYIGSQQPGGGSDIAKGRRYLKHKLNCSNRAIKRTASKRYKVLNNSQFREYGIEVYFFHSEFCVQIVKETIKFIADYADDASKQRIFGHLPNGSEYLDLTYAYRLSELNWVLNEDYQNQGKMARDIYRDFENLRNNLDA